METWARIGRSQPRRVYILSTPYICTDCCETWENFVVPMEQQGREGWGDLQFWCINCEALVVVAMNSWKGGRQLRLRSSSWCLKAFLLFLCALAVVVPVVFFHYSTISYFLRPIWDTPPKPFQVGIPLIPVHWFLEKNSWVQLYISSIGRTFEIDECLRLVS